MQKLWKVLSTSALVAVLSVTMVVPTFAFNGDITDKATNTTYLASEYNSNTQKLNTLIDQLIKGTRDQFIYEYGGQNFKFDDFSDRVTALINTGSTPNAAKTTASADASLLDSNQATTVTSVGTVSGTAKVGVQLTAGATASYQWQIGSTASGVYANISGATTNNYVPVASDATKYIKVVVTGTGSYSGTVTSVAAGPVSNADVPVVGTPINLGTAGNYAILAETGISSAPPSVITGDIGDGPAAASYITGFGLTAVGTYSTSPQVTGKIYAADYTPPTPGNLTTAVSDMQTAYTDAAGRTAAYTELYTGDLSGKSLNAGVYKWGNSVLINSDVTLQGGANDVFVFEIAGGITQAANTHVILTGGVQAKNVFWQSAQTVSIGTGAHFEGIVLGMTNITLKTGASISGRLLAQTAVTLDQSTVTSPAL